MARGLILVPERRELFAAMSVADNLELGGFQRARSGERGWRSTRWTRSTSGFRASSERREQLAGTLSGGERQMLAMGRALMGKPKLLMLDEPSLGLAPLMVREIFSIVADLRSAGVADPAGRAERAGGAADLRLRLRAGDGRARPRRAERGAGRESARGGDVSGAKTVAAWMEVRANGSNMGLSRACPAAVRLSIGIERNSLTDLSVPPVNSALLADARHLLLEPASLDDIALSGVLASIHTHDIDFADLYFQYSRMESWSLEEGIVKAGSFSIDRGVGIRAVHGEKQAFAYSDDISLAALERGGGGRAGDRSPGAVRGRRPQSHRARRIRCTRRPTRSHRCRKKPRSRCWNGSSRWRASATRAWRR